MLVNSKLPRSFWAEVMSTACYLVNRSPLSAIVFKTPKKIWLGRLVKYDNLIIFLCFAYAYINQGKLKLKALKGLFVGYLNGVKGYKIWCKQPKECIINKDVIFNEATMVMAGKELTEIDMQIERDVNKSLESSKFKVEFL